MANRIRGVCAASLAALAVIGAAETACAQAMQGDRYGPERSVSQAPAQAYAPPYQPGAPYGEPSPAQVRALGRMLSWPGKVVSLAPPPTPMQAQAYAPRPARTGRPAAARIAARVDAPSPYRSQPYSSARYASAAYGPATASPGYFAASDEPLAPASAASPHYGLVRAVPPRPDAPTPVLAGAPARPLPQSIYDTPPPATASATLQTASAAPALHAGWAPPRRPWSGAYGDSVRLYSVHRAYGLKPDPAPIPPQFFAATADVADPAGPIAGRRTISGSGTAAQAARAVQASDADTDTAQP